MDIWMKISSILTLGVASYSLYNQKQNEKKHTKEKNIENIQNLIKKIDMIPTIVKGLLDSIQPTYTEKSVTVKEHRPLEQCWSAKSVILPTISQDIVTERICSKKAIDITSSQDYISSKKALDELNEALLQTFNENRFKADINGIKTYLVELENSIRHSPKNFSQDSLDKYFQSSLTGVEDYVKACANNDKRLMKKIISTIKLTFKRLALT